MIKSTGNHFNEYWFPDLHIFISQKTTRMTG